jgi:hypothetical protein
MISSGVAALLIILLMIAAMITNAYALKYATNHFYIDKISVALIPLTAILLLIQI